MVDGAIRRRRPSSPSIVIFGVDDFYVDVFPKELPVSESDTSRSINSDDVLVKLPNFDHYTCLIPLQWILAGLILYSDMIAD